MTNYRHTPHFVFLKQKALVLTPRLYKKKRYTRPQQRAKFETYATFIYCRRCVRARVVCETHT